jgi:hypothetical protein
MYIIKVVKHHGNDDENVLEAVHKCVKSGPKYPLY